MHIIYRTINLVNDKDYIGQRTVHDKLNLDPWYLGSGKIITRAIDKYGRENFTREVLAIVDSQDTANELEKYYIKYYRSIGRANYNIAEGGNSGGVLLNANIDREGYDNWRAELSKSAAKRWTSEERDKYSRMYSGENNNFYQKTHSEEALKLMSESSLRLWSTPEYREKQSKSHSNKSWMNNGSVEKQVPYQEIDDHLSSGWVIGRMYHERKVHTKRRRYLFKDDNGNDVIMSFPNRVLNYHPTWKLVGPYDQ